MKKILSICLIVLVVYVLLTACQYLHVHQYGEWVVTEAATCDEKGTQTRTCPCGEKESVTISPTGHEEKIIEGKAATCTSPGLTDGKSCKNCGEILVEQEEIPALDHNIITDSAKTPTCTEDGLTEGKHCDRCDYKIAQEVIPALGHTAGDEADCLNAQICTVCNTKLAPAKGHTEVIDEAKAPTCTEIGLAEGKHCSDCGEILVAQTELNKIAHTYDDNYDESCNVCGFIRDAECAHIDLTILPAKDANCTENGLTEGKVCSKCQEILVAQETIPALGHTAGDEATCTDDQICTTCGKVLASALGHNPGEWIITMSAGCETDGERLQQCQNCRAIVGHETIPALGHTAGDEATCTDAQTCTTCGKVLASALGHNPGEWIITMSAGCETYGERLQQCQNCRAIVGHETIPALGHTAGDEATCTDAQICTACGKVLASALGHNPGAEADCENAQICTVCKVELVEALGHNLVDVDGKAATCTEPGYTAYKDCSRCDHIEGKEEINALGHNMITDAAKAPTCTEAGLTEGSHCSRCDYKVAQKEVPALGHNMVTDAAKAPTCTETGLTEGSHCSRCDHKVAQETIDALGHTEGEKQYTLPEFGCPCEMERIYVINCTVCGTPVKNGVEDPTGHSYTNYILAERDPNTPICEHIPIEVAECDNCDCINCLDTRVIGVAPGHRYEATVVEPTCTKGGHTEHLCAACGDSYTTDPTEAKGHSFADGECTVCHEPDPNYTTIIYFQNNWLWSDVRVYYWFEDGTNNAAWPGKSIGAIENDGTYDIYMAEIPAGVEGVIFNGTKNDGSGALDQTPNITPPHKGCVCYYMTWNNGNAVGSWEYHIYRNEITKEPTCTEAGERRYTCISSACGSSYTEEIKANGHDLVTLAAKAPTCTETGLTEGSHCSRCDHKVAQEVVPALGHNMIADAAKAPTCTETGLTEGSHCSRCDYKVAQKEVPALGHTEKDAVVENRKESSCTAEGSYDSVIYCAVCDEEIKRETKKIEMLPHSEVILPAIEATCTMSGATEGKYCSVCQNVLVEQTFIPAKDHNYIDGTCDVCGAIDPDHYFVMTIPEALVADDGKMVAVSGTVCTINTIWTDTNNNFSVTIVDGNGNQIYVYRLATKVELGDIITVKGAMATYNGNRQIGQGGIATVEGHDSSYDYYEFTIEDALTVPDNTNVIVSGIVVAIGIDYSETYGNMSVYISDTLGTARLYLYRLTGKVELGDIITVKGSMGTYNGQRQITGGTFEKTGEHGCTDFASPTCQQGSHCRFCGKSWGEPYNHKDDDRNHLCDYDCGTVMIPYADSTITIKDAIDIASLMSQNQFTPCKYYITGRIAEIASTTYGNMYLTDDEGNTIYVYGFYNADGTARFDAMENQPGVGDIVTVYAVIGYYDKVEIKNAWMKERYPVVDGSVGLTYSLNEGGESYTVTGRGVCGDADIVIPAEYMGLPVTHIGEDAFANDSTITSVTMPDSVTEIGSWAFGGCERLTSVRLSDNITTLPSRVFYRTAITSIVLPESFKVIDKYAFQSCYSLETITIPKTLESIGTEAFDGCPITTVYYGGSESDWANISIVDYCNDAIKNASKVYNYIYGE